jgi:phosphoglycolate phosphatase-like HAD superfamily hydrolase
VYGKSDSLSKVDKFQAILAANKLEPENVIHITDKIGDAKEALSQGISVILVTWGYQPKNRLESIQHLVLAIVDSPQQLGEFIQTNVTLQK